MRGRSYARKGDQTLMKTAARWFFRQKSPQGASRDYGASGLSFHTYSRSSSSSSDIRASSRSSKSLISLSASINLILYQF